jgi:hypothetical protein
VTFTPGVWSVRFIASSFASKNGQVNALKTEKFTVAKPSLELAVPASGGSIDRVQLNSTQKKLQVRFLPVPGQTLDVTSITDSAAEFTLAGAAAAGVVLGVPTKSSDDDQVYVYPFTGTFGTGEVTLSFVAAGFSDTAGNTSEAATVSFTVNGATAALRTPSVDVAQLNRQKYIDIQFKPTSGATLTDSSISDAAAEFALSGTAAASVTLASVPTSQGGGVWRYGFTGAFVPGSVTLTFAADSFTDSLNNSSLPQSTTLTVVGSTATAKTPAVGSIASLQTLNTRQWFDIRYTGADGSSIDPASVSDTDPEFTVSGAGAGSVAITTFEKIDASTWRYHFTGTFSAGVVNLLFTDGAVKDMNNVPSVASTQSWTDADSVPQLGFSGRVDVASINATDAGKKLLVTFHHLRQGHRSHNHHRYRRRIRPEAGDANGNLQDIPNVVLNGAGVAKAGTANTWEYSFTGNLPDASVIVVTWQAGSWADVDGNAGGTGTAEFRTFSTSTGMKISISGSSNSDCPSSSTVSKAFSPSMEVPYSKAKPMPVYHAYRWTSVVTPR